MGCSESNFVSPTKLFDCQAEPFDSSYQKSDISQKKMSGELLPHLIQSISGLQKELDRPIKILDCCCGYGNFAFDLLQKLEEVNVPVETITGFDISEESISAAQQKNNHPKLTFFKANLEEFSDQPEAFDVCLVIFGLHWMNDINLAVRNIARSLRS